MKIIAGFAVGLLGVWLFLILQQLKSISRSLEMFAKAWNEDFRITVPGNKSFRIDLPDGGEITQRIEKRD